MRNVVAYCRVSTDGQVGEDKFGLVEQKNIVMDYCAKHDMQISEWYIDEGESGAKESRPALDDLLYGETKNPPVTAVIVPKSDRIARDIKLYFYYMMVLERKNIELISATEEVVNDDTGLGNVYKALIMFVAQKERENITMRTMGGRRNKAKTGGYSGGRPPYGYKPVDGKLVVVPEEAEIVKYVIDARNKKVLWKDICDKLNSEGKKNRSGTPFSVSTLQVIVKNEPLYKGFYRYGETLDWIKGQHEPILKKEDD